jgi:hypothetical protein
MPSLYCNSRLHPVPRLVSSTKFTDDFTQLAHSLHFERAGDAALAISTWAHAKLLTNNGELHGMSRR